MRHAKEKLHGRALVFCAMFIIMLFVGGCYDHLRKGKNGYAYKQMSENIDTLFQVLQHIDVNSSGEIVVLEPPSRKKSSSVDEKESSTEDTEKKSMDVNDRMSIAYVEASFCLERAVESFRSSKRNQVTNDLMLGAAALTGATGLGLSAASVARRELDGISVAAAVTSVLPGAILGAREAFKTYEVAKARRIAAARNIEAALTILKNYALADDPADLKEDGFAVCRESDVEIANSYSGAAAADSIARPNDDPETASQEASAAAEKAAEEKKKEAQKADDVVEDLQAELKVKTKDSSESSTELTEDLKKRLEKAEQEADEANEQAKRAQREAEIRKEIASAVSEVIAAYARLRRTILFMATTIEIRTTFKMLEDASIRLDLARAALVELELEDEEEK